MFNGHLTSQWCILQDHYVRRHKIHTVTHTSAGWSLHTITVLWNNCFALWHAWNESIHGHDLASQQLACRRKLGFEMEFLHAQRDQVIACDADTFIGDTPAALTQYLDVDSASQVQNWMYTWKPFIQSSIDSAKDLSLQGVRQMYSYFPTEDTTPWPLNRRAHCKACLCLRATQLLLKYFFGTNPRPSPPP
jgi:hypothetical protein